MIKKMTNMDCHSLSLLHLDRAGLALATEGQSVIISFRSRPVAEKPFINCDTLPESKKFH